MKQRGNIDIQQHEQDYASVDSLITGRTNVQSGIAQMPIAEVPPILCLVMYTHHLEILNRCDF